MNTCEKYDNKCEDISRETLLKTLEETHDEILDVDWNVSDEQIE